MTPLLCTIRSNLLEYRNRISEFIAVVFKVKGSNQSGKKERGKDPRFSLFRPIFELLKNN